MLLVGWQEGHLVCKKLSVGFLAEPQTHDHKILTHIHTFNGPLSGTTQVSWYQKGKTSLDFTEARDSKCHGISWAMCKSADNHASIPPLSFSDALPAAQPTASKH